MAQLKRVVYGALHDEMLLKCPDVDSTNEDGYTLLYTSALKGNRESVENLIALGANPNKPSKDGLTPLHAAAQRKRGDIVDYLILHGADVSVTCDEGETPVHKAAATGHTQIITSLLAAGTDVNKMDNTGWTAFNTAIENGNLYLTRFLIENGAKHNTYDGMTPLYLAARSGHLHIVQNLVSHGADVNEEDDEGMIPLHGAAANGYMDVMEYLIQQESNVNKGDVNGWTPLHAAVEYGHMEAVKLLIDKGAKQADSEGDTLLYSAVDWGHFDIAHFLISKGADVNEDTDNGRIPLHAAAVADVLSDKRFQELIESHINKRLSKFETELEKQEARIMELEIREERRAQEIQAALLEKDAIIKNLMLQSNKQEQYSRRSCLRFFGFEESANENTDDIILKAVNDNLGVSLSKNELEKTHRVGPKQKTNPSDPNNKPKPRPIIAKFISYRKRSEIFRERRKFAGKKKSIQEDLTKDNATLLSLSRTCPKTITAWTSDGRVIALIPGSNGKGVKKLITCKEDLDSLPETENLNT